MMKLHGNAPEATPNQRQGLAKFLYDIARAAFGAAATAVCLKGDMSIISASLLFALVVALIALGYERRSTR